MTNEGGSEPVVELNRRGVANFAELVDGGEQRLQALFRTVPALGEVAVGVVYGHLHERSALDPRTREVATLAAIVAAGMVGPPLSVHVRTGLASGLAPAEITETVVQTAAFAGFPRAVSAASELNRLFDELDLTSPPAPAPREVVLAMLDDARAGRAVDPCPPDVAALLAATSDVTVTATGPDRVVVELLTDDHLAALLHVSVHDGKVTGARIYR